MGWRSHSGRRVVLRLAQGMLWAATFGAGGQLSGQQQTGVPGQGVVVGSDLDVAGAWATMHLTGVLSTGPTDV